MKVPVWLRSCRCTKLRITEGVTRQRIEQTPPSGETVCKYVGPVCHSFHKHAHFCPWTGMPRTWRIPGSQLSPRFPTKWAQESPPADRERTQDVKSTGLLTRGAETSQLLVKTSRFFYAIQNWVKLNWRGLGAELTWRHDLGPSNKDTCETT